MSRPSRSDQARPVYADWRILGLVMVGGTVGTALRELITLATPPTGVFPAATFGINLLGSFLLGVLLESLLRRGPDQGALRVSRLLFGAGLLGGFTTFSALATDTVLLLTKDETGTAVAYALGSTVLGVALAGAGIALAAYLHRRLPAGRAEAPE